MCPESTQKSRRCNEDRWEISPKESQVMPIILVEGTQGHYFCPSKLFRDDPATVRYCDELFLSWKTGTQVASNDDTIQVDFAMDLVNFIKLWERYEKNESFKFLSRLLVGDGKD